MTTTTIIRVNDRVTLGADSQRQMLPNGFMRVPAKIGRTGVQTYLASELGITDRPPNAVIRVYRPPAEVFAPDTLASFASVAVTDDHPAGPVTTDNVAALQVGWSDHQVTQGGGFMETVLTIAAKTAQDKIAAGKVELSNGYDCELVWGQGVVPDGQIDAGQTYDAFQRKITGNHIALVVAGRCGDHCRIADHAAKPVTDCSCGGSKGESPMADAALKTITVDGVPIQTTDQGEAIIRKLEAQVTQANDARVKAEADAAAQVATANDKATKAEADLAAAQAQIPTGAMLDKMVADRQALITTAKRLAPTLDAAGKTDAEIRRAAVLAKLGDQACAGRDDAFFAHAYDALVLQLPAQDGARPPGATGNGQDPLANIVQNGVVSKDAAQTRDAAWQKASEDLTSAWKTPAA